MDALSNLSFDTPTGPVSLDENRNAIANMYVTEVQAGPEGNLVNNVVSVAEGVNQLLGNPPDSPLFAEPVSRTSPDCP